MAFYDVLVLALAVTYAACLISLAWPPHRGELFF